MHIEKQLVYANLAAITLIPQGWEGSNGSPLLIYLSSHENHFYTSPGAPGLLIKFI